MMIRKRSFTVPCWFVAAAVLQELSTTTMTVDAQTSNFVQTLVQCGGNDASSRNYTGYVTIEAMNLDMQVELDQIRNGRPSQEPYVFPLCPDVVFDLSIEPLRPILSGSIFTCGLMGNVSLRCEFRGGTDQIIVTDNATDYDLVSVNLIGITHTGFTNSVLSGSATSATTIDLTRSSFHSFSAPSVVRQVNDDDGIAPFNVQISESTVSNATGTGDSTIFLNLGGELSIQDVSLDSSILMSFVTTGSSNTTEGATFLRRVTVKNSDISDLFIAMQAADIDAMDVTVTGMSNILTAFDIEGDGTTAVLENIIIRNNNIAQTNPNNLWVGVNVRDNAFGTITNGTFIDNSNMRHIFSASMNATLDIKSSRIIGASGGRIVNERDISAGVFSNIQSMVTLANLIMEDTSSFTAIYFAGGGSSMTIRNTCIGEGNNQGTIYISEESSYIAESNYIDPNFVSSVCEETGMRLIQELPGSGCFDVNRTDCEFNCTSFVEVDTCMVRLETFSPSVAPVNMTQTPTATSNETFQPTIATSIPSSIGMTINPQPSAGTIKPSGIPVPIPTEMPIVLPPSFTATSSPMSDRRPTSLPIVTPAPSMEESFSVDPSRVPRPSLRPTTQKGPTFFETQLPTSTIQPSTSKCDCYSGKGTKSKKKKGNGKGMGKGKGKGKGKGDGADVNNNDDWSLLNYLSDDDSINSHQRRNVYYGDKTDDDDDDCICHESGKGKGKKGHGKGGKNEHKSDSYSDIESESNSRANDIFLLLGKH